MNLRHITPILNVSDVPASLAWFEMLGWQRRFTWNDGGMIDAAADRNSHGPALFAGIGIGHLEMFLCNGAQGSRGTPPDQIRSRLQPGKRLDDDTPGVWMSWWVGSPAEVDEAYEQCKKHDVFVACPPTDEPWGVREMRIMHPDGHTFRVSAFITRATTPQPPSV